MAGEAPFDHRKGAPLSSRLAGGRRALGPYAVVEQHRLGWAAIALGMAMMAGGGIFALLAGS